MQKVDRLKVKNLVEYKNENVEKYDGHDLEMEVVNIFNLVPKYMFLLVLI
jgi:hypothetical protein